MQNQRTLTPGGYRHPSFVHRLRPGQAVIKRKGKSRKINTESKRSYKLRLPAPEAGPIPGLGSGWITDSTWTNTTGQPVTSFTTTWTVPNAPATQNGQTVFLFNALLDAAENDILQPVLQWGASEAGGGSYWAAGCWFVDEQGNAFYKSLAAVNPGDVLVGVMTLTSSDGGMFRYDCNFQGIAGVDLTIHTDTELVVATETLECYGIQACSDYPGSASTTMTGIQIIAGGVVPVPWVVENRVGDCGQNAVLSGADVTINY